MGIINFWRRIQKKKEYRKLSNDWQFILEWHPNSRLAGNWYILQLPNTDIYINIINKEISVMDTANGKYFHKNEVFKVIEPFRISLLNYTQRVRDLCKSNCS